METSTSTSAYVTRNYKEVEEALFEWFLDAQGRNIPIKGPLLIKKANDFPFLSGSLQFSPGGGWVQRFKERHGVVYRAIVGEGAAVNQDMADN
ncbi:hypothetical protein HPB47_003836 [Ixodes persulcatus]|uniref:Uncharacterized protein n=1 Tax=Ixodes persulcatus TaxID=34615 RepID=A0AC60PHC7_IXOPE|nr:hypothetical protein HPB47_003836 [Ixodes persulcatus]